VFGLLTAGLRNPYDQWLTIADFRSYVDAQAKVNAAYSNQDEWNRMSIINTATSGKFSSDRTINEYATEIWGIEPVSR
jgi:starch phosphorylase